MKQKHLSLVILLMAAVVVGSATWYGIYHHGASINGPRIEPIKPLSELKVPNRSELEMMDLLERQMHLLSAPPPRSGRSADLSALGYFPVSPVDPSVAGADNTDKTPPAFRVTLAFEGQEKPYCVIDNELYPEGATLPDGSTILKIESRRVLIAKESMQQWLLVDSFLGTTGSDQG